MNDSRPIQRIAIAGHGFEAWFTANHLLAGLGGKRIEIVICPVAGSSDLDGLYSVLPLGPGDGLGAIGIDVPILLRHCAASFSLGAVFNGRPRPYGSIGADINGLPFHHHWLRSGGPSASDYFEWSPAAAAMLENRFAPPMAENAIGSLQHGMAMHADIERLTRLLRARALNSAASECTGEFAAVQRDDQGHVTGLLADTGEHVTADLYIDCSGKLGLLAGEHQGFASGAAVQTGGLTLSISRLESTKAPAPCHSIEGMAEGWNIDIPGNGWNTRIQMCEEAPGDETALTGHLSDPWRGKVVAIGQAAARLPAVEPIHARLLAVSVKRLLELLPDSECSPAETREYNHLFKTDLDEIEDLFALYELARRSGFAEITAPPRSRRRPAGPGWVSRASRAVPEGPCANGMPSSAAAFRRRREQGSETPHSSSLARRVSLFRQRGWIIPSDGEILTPGHWAGTLLLLGVVPRKHDRLAERIPRARLDEILTGLRQRIRQVSDRFPPLEKYLGAGTAATRT